MLKVDMETITVTINAIVGVVIWEVVKFAYTSHMGNREKSKETKKILVRLDIEEIAKLVCEIQELSIAYFQLPYTSDMPREKATLIRAKLKTCGMKIHSINVANGLSEQSQISSHMWIQFKKSCTLHLDVLRIESWHEDDEKFQSIFKNATTLHSHLNKIRYEQI